MPGTTDAIRQAAWFITSRPLDQHLSGNCRTVRRLVGNPHRQLVRTGAKRAVVGRCNRVQSSESSGVRPLQAIIDLDAIAHNLNVARAHAKSSRVAAVVKADAYGHGAVGILPALESADMLAVASIEEAHRLRDAGARQPVLLLEGVFDAGEIHECVARNFEIAFHCDEQLQMLESRAVAGSVAAWLKIDTGMCRLGFATNRAQQAHRRLAAHPGVARPITVMSHLASADEPDRQPTIDQLQRLMDVHREIGGPLSLANSAGTLGYPATCLDIVRPGIMLYGQSPIAGQHGRDHGLRAAMTLLTSVIALHDVAQGDSVGYGAAWRAARPSRVATLAVGYGDGYPRSANEAAAVLIDGRRASLAGRVSMDMIGVDVTDLPEVKIGDRVELWGPGLPIEDLARSAGTIGYEIVSKVSGRVPRDYVRASQSIGDRRDPVQSVPN